MTALATARESMGVALSTAFARADDTGQAWRLTGRPPLGQLELTATLEDGRWIVLETHPVAVELEAVADWDRLTRASALPDGVRWASGGSPRLRSELPFDAAVDIASRLVATTTALEEAADLLRRAIVPAPSGEAKARDEGRAQTLADLCAESGWTHHPSPDGSIRVDLDVPGDFRQAELRLDHTGFRATVNIALPDQVGAPSRAAVARMLTLANGTVRLVRVCIADARQGPIVRVEAGYAFAPVAAEVGEALAALSVAVGCWVAELEVLGADEALASAYLAAQESRERQRNQRHEEEDAS